MATRCLSLVASILAVALLSVAAVSACLDVGFYDRTCPAAETIVQQTVAAAFRNHSGVAPALIRLHFHDCFVRGCDGSVLIDSTASNTAEKDAPPNNPSLRFFDVVDSAKSAVEARCPGVVSCADILAFAARDGVKLAGGVGYPVPAGRRDGRVSREADANNDLPAPTSTAAQLVDNFAAKNLGLDDVVVLSGAHSIGVSHCSSFLERIYNFTNTTDGIDPSLSKAYAFLLQSVCPPNTTDFFPTTTLFMDMITPTRLDNKYYVGLANNLGMFQSDVALLRNATMKKLVHSFIRSDAAWKRRFARSMVKMGRIRVMSGTQGEIRRNCRVINPVNAIDDAGAHHVLPGSVGSSSGLSTGVATS